MEYAISANLLTSCAGSQKTTRYIGLLHSYIVYYLRVFLILLMVKKYQPVQSTAPFDEAVLGNAALAERYMFFLFFPN